MTSVLVVDDTAIDRRLIAAVIEGKLQWTVHYATNGKEALEFLESERPDVIVTDMQMPEMDGLELLCAVRHQYKGIPVIIVTGRGSEELAVQALRMGAASYLPKSEIARRLVETLEQVRSTLDSERDELQLMTHLHGLDVSFVLGNSLAVMRPLTDYLQQLLAALQICDVTERQRVSIALEEAIKNAYQYGSLELSSELSRCDQDAYYALARERAEQSPYRERKIHIRATYSPEKAVFWIRDEGPGFDPSRLPDPTDPEQLSRPTGRGILLMATFMDELRFNESGNEVMLAIVRRTHVE